MIKIDNIDSIDHITDFSSTADHALTLRKWQELDLPIFIQEKKRHASGKLPHARSVFDSQYDNTQIGERKSLSSPAKERWKYKGPWLAGKADGEFKDYVDKKVKRRKLDFRRYLGNHLAESKAAAGRRDAIEKGEDFENLEDSNSETFAVSEEEVEGFIKHLRNNEMDLHILVQEYLDLPREEGQSLGGSSSQYDEKGPPTTHPSAGLSYLRTDSHIYNHPHLGPQESKAPIQGRVIVPQKTGDRANPQALIGVAGVVGKDSRMTFYTERNDKSIAPVSQFAPDIPGGGKLWTQPKRASIDSHGRIEMLLDRADRNALDVALGVHSDGPKLPSAAIAAAHDREVPVLTQTRPRSSGSYPGYGLEGTAGTNGSGRATPFLGPDDQAPNTEIALHELLRTGAMGSKK